MIIFLWETFSQALTQAVKIVFICRPWPIIEQKDDLKCFEIYNVFEIKRPCFFLSTSYSVVLVFSAPGGGGGGDIAFYSMVEVAIGHIIRPNTGILPKRAIRLRRINRLLKYLRRRIICL